MEMKTLGRNGPQVGEIGLGCMGMSPGVYGPNDEAEGIATIRAALDAGVTLIDTGDFYGMGHNEMLIRRALEDVPRSNVVISVKFGALRDPAGMFGGNDSRPQAVKNFLAYSLKRLGTDYIDIYRPARLDPAVPIEDTIGAIADMIRAGYVRHVGLSEVGAETVKRAHAVHPIVDLQIEYSLMSRGIEDAILPTTRATRDRHHRLRRAVAWHLERTGAAAHAIKATFASSACRVSGRQPRKEPDAWSRRCGRSAMKKARARRNSPSPGCAHAAPISCRCSAPGAATSSRKRSARSTSTSMPPISRASTQR